MVVHPWTAPDVAKVHPWALHRGGIAFRDTLPSRRGGNRRAARRLPNGHPPSGRL